MFIIVITLLVLLVIAVICLAIVSNWYIKAADAGIKYKEDYFALEKGMDEQQEGYEAMILDHLDTIAKYEAALLSRDQDVQILFHVATHHADNCIPDYAPVLGEQEYETLNYYSNDHTKYDDRIKFLSEVPKIG